ncbi:cytochrome P450 [Streptomyces sp. NBC_00656]|uniref:cytochrome P450 n=1 Tax=Streptomyces sp. NBC_00656 TaxID=2903668 RepID=UPI00324EB9A5
MTTTQLPGAGVAPGAWPLLGHLWHLHNHPLEFLSSLPAHGDLVRIMVGTSPVYVVCDPSAVHQILTDSRTFDKGGPLFDRARELFLGNSLPLSGWREHQWQRRLMQPAFQPEHIERYAAVMSEEVDRMTSRWRPGLRLDVTDAMTALTLRIVTRSVLAADMQDEAVAAVEEYLHTVMDGTYRRVMLPLGPLYRLPTRGNRRYRRALDRLHHDIDALVAARRAAPGDDLVSLLLAGYDDTGAPMSDKDIREQLVVTMAAGFETTACTLSFALWLLSQLPDIAERLHAEVDAALAGRTAELADLDRLPYTQRFVGEVLRLYPPVWLFTRVTTADTTLAGCPLPAGTAVLYSAYLLQHRPDLFPSPDLFDPDRRAAPAGAGRRGALVPFGGGNRKCIGDRFALVEMSLALATVCARWSLAPDPGATLRVRARGTLGPGRLPMTCRPRGTTVAAPGDDQL